MKKIFLSLMLITIATLACSMQLTDPTPIPPPPPTQVVIVVTAAPTPTLPPTAATSPTLAPATVIVTATPSAPTSSAPVAVKIFLIALGDNGKSGKKIGCDDSVVGVTVSVPPTAGVLRAAIEALLAVKTPTYGQSGLTSALYLSTLKIDGVNLVDGKATIALSGTFALAGICESPRIQAQFEETAKQFSTVKTLEVLINGRELSTYR